MSEWDPINHSYEQALGSGSFELIRDEELRLLIAKYVGALATVTSFTEQINEQYRGQLEPFMVSHTVYSDLAAPDVRDLLITEGAPFATDLEALAASRELWNLLTLKMELELIMVSTMVKAEARATELVAALPDSQ